jgi:hypothetical protein
MTPAKRAELTRLRLARFGNPATDVRTNPEPADARPRFGRGPLHDRLVDRFDRAEEEYGDVSAIVAAAAAGDPAAQEVLDNPKHKREIAWYLAEASEREKAAAPARALADQRQALAQLGFDVPENVAVETFYEAHRVEILAKEHASHLRVKAQELSAEAEKTAADADAAMKAKENA